MDMSRVLRVLAAVLITISGIIHLGSELFYTLAGTEIPGGSFMVGAFIVFGVIYIIIGVGLLSGKQLFIYIGMIIPLVGGIGGTSNFITGLSTGASSLVLFVIALIIVIDVFVILCCGYLLLHRKPT
jgi:hypothetical protein